LQTLWEWNARNVVLNGVSNVVLNGVSNGVSDGVSNSVALQSVHLKRDRLVFKTTNLF
jgi:hypothetical protein